MSIAAYAICIGSLYFVLIEIGKHVSGGIYNPSITLALVINKTMKSSVGSAYIIAQALGSMTGAFLTTTHMTTFYDTITSQKAIMKVYDPFDHEKAEDTPDHSSEMLFVLPPVLLGSIFIVVVYLFMIVDRKVAKDVSGIACAGCFVC